MFVQQPHLQKLCYKEFWNCSGVKKEMILIKYETKTKHGIYTISFKRYMVKSIYVARNGDKQILERIKTLFQEKNAEWKKWKKQIRTLNRDVPRALTRIPPFTVASGQNSKIWAKVPYGLHSVNRTPKACFSLARSINREMCSDLNTINGNT